MHRRPFCQAVIAQQLGHGHIGQRALAAARGILVFLDADVIPESGLLAVLKPDVAEIRLIF